MRRRLCSGCKLSGYRGFYVFEMFCRSNQVSRTISRSVSYSLPQVTTRCALCPTTTTASTATTTTAPMVAQQTLTVRSPTLCVGRFSLTDADVVRIQTARLFIYSHDRFWGTGHLSVLFSVTFNQVGYTCSSTDSRCTAPVGKVLLESVKVREQIIKQTLMPSSLQFLLLSFLWLANHCLSCV